MREKEPVSTKTETAISVTELRLFAQDWLTDCKLRQHSPRTIEVRQDFIKNLFWFLEKRSYTSCGSSELRDFFRYLMESHLEPEGRWGNPKNRRQLRPITIKDYHTVLKGWFNWLVKDEAIASSPLARIAAPIARLDQKEPLNPEQIDRLLAASRTTCHHKRDETIVSILLDTGIRATELCSLQMKDMNLENRSFRVRGKGNKHRECYIGKATGRLLSAYLRTQGRGPEDPVFTSDRGHSAGEPLTRSGLLQLFTRLSHTAGIHPSVSPHQMRRTFAVSILRNGANLPTVQRLMGHTNIAMTQKYLLLAQADIEAQHRACSPRDFLKFRPEELRR